MFHFSSNGVFLPQVNTREYVPSAESKRSSHKDPSAQSNSRERCAGNGADSELGISIPVFSAWPFGVETNVFLEVYLFFFSSRIHFSFYESQWENTVPFPVF